MFNVAVIRLKDLVRFFIFGIIIISLIVFCKNLLKKIKLEKINIREKVSTNIEEHIKKSIKMELPNIEENNQKKTAESSSNNIIKKIIGIELGLANVREKIQEKNETSNEMGQNVKNESKENHDEERDVEFAKENVKTEIITKNPIIDAYTKKYNGVKIKNETSFDLTKEDLRYEELKIDKTNIILFHTHTCESYTSSQEYTYMPTGNFRTTDFNYSVVRVGDELTKYLKKYKLNVIHDKTYHDYPSYTGSYSRSLSTVREILKNTDADIIIDLHRDAIGSYSSYAPTVKIGDDECAQLMFVIGTDGGKLKHPNWKSNLQFAIKLQEKANKEYPGLFKPIIVRNSRYNQHLGKAACIIEVGATGNKLEQCLNSMKYLSKIINEI